MYLRDDPANPQNMDDVDQLEEVASILARGILRLYRRRTPHLPVVQDSPESSPSSLDLPGTLRPDRPAG